MDKLHFSHILQSQANKYGKDIALYAREQTVDEWTSYSWEALSTLTISAAKALIEIGVVEHECVGQFSHNKAENIIVDFASYANRAVVVPMYATSTVPQVTHIVNDAEIKVIFVGDQREFDVAYEVMQSSSFLKKIIVFDNQVAFTETDQISYFADFIKRGELSSKHFELEHRQNDALDEDLAMVLYTSGTTGTPKGVMMLHSALNEAMRIHSVRLTSISEKETSVAFLPLSHIFERTWSYFCIYKGVKNYINTEPNHIQQTLLDVRPSLMCSVPRFWEKVYHVIKTNMTKSSPIKLGLISWAIAVGRKYNIEILNEGKTPCISQRLEYALAEKLVFSKIKYAVGINNMKMMPVAGARLSDDIALFFISIGVPIVYGYGLTESTATVSCFPYKGFKIGTVGTIMPNVQVKIGDNNEILLKGKTITPGYYKNAEATKEVFTHDGWFKTGDAGFLQNDTIMLTDRIKDLFKTSNGKYIAPQEIESKLTQDPYINQVIAIGDERNFVTALIVPFIPALESYAQKNNITYPSIDMLLKLEAIYELIESRITILQKDMASYEQIKRFTLIPDAFSMETGELTNTLKTRRNFVLKKYYAEIEKMYLD